MSLVAGNRRALYLAVQADKATVATTPTLRLRLRDQSKPPVRDIIALQETDAAAQEAASVVSGFSPRIQLAHYLRPNEASLLFYALLGGAATTGSTPNFVHELTPEQATPYVTLWEVEPGEWSNRFEACRLTQLTLSGGAGQPLELTGLQWEALDYTAHVTEPTEPAAPVAELPFIYPHVTVTRGGVADGTVDQFSITISRGGQRIQGDNGFKSLDYVNGLFAVAGTITQYKSDDADMRAVDTGSTSGTDPTATIATQALSILAAKDANTRVELAMTKISLATATAGLNTDGSPLSQVLAFRTEPTTDIEDNLTVTVKNQVENADHSPPE